MPYPWAKAIDQIPTLCPAFPPPAGLTLIGALHVLTVWHNDEREFASSVYFQGPYISEFAD